MPSEPGGHYEGTSELVGVNHGCRITWTVIAEPLPGRDGEFDALVSRAEVAVGRGLDAVVRGAGAHD